MIAFFKKHKLEIGLFLFALVLRVGLFFINLHANGGNFEETIHGSDWYFEVAKHLAVGAGFSIDGSAPSPIHVPVYPYFLASSLVLFGSFCGAVVVQMLAGACIPVLGRRLSLRLIRSEKVAFFVGIALALEPNLVLFSSIFFTETIFIFLFLLFFLFLFDYVETHDPKKLAVSSLLLGVATLTKTVTEFLPVVLLPVLVWYLRKRLSAKKLVFHGLIFASVFAAVLAPWLYRNKITFGAAGMTIMPTFNLYSTLVPSVLMTENHTSFNDAREAFLATQTLKMRDLTFATAPQFTHEAISVLLEHPGALMKVSAINIVTFFTHDGLLTVLQNAGITPNVYLGKPALELLLASPLRFAQTASGYLFSPFVLVLLFRLFWICATVLFFTGYVMFFRRKKLTAPLMLVFVTVLYFALTTPTNGLTVNARFRMPIEPIILAIAAYPIAVWKKNEN